MNPALFFRRFYLRIEIPLRAAGGRPVSYRHEGRLCGVNPESAAKPYSDGAWSMEIEVDVRTRDSLMGERDLASVDALKLHFQGNELKKGGGRSMLAGLRVLFLESTGMEIDSVALVVPFTREAGFRYLHIAGEGKMGAAIMLIREALPTGLWTVQIFDRGDAV